MIKFTELCKYQSKTLPPEHLRNLEDLLTRLNKFREAYGKPLHVTSGYRSMADHLRIYAAKGITDEAKIPMKSKHLIGLAGDVAPVEDDIKHLQDWVKDNVGLCEDLGLYFEDFSATPTWVHIQAVPPKSGKRFFYP